MSITLAETDDDLDVCIPKAGEVPYFYLPTNSISILDFLYTHRMPSLASLGESAYYCGMNHYPLSWPPVRLVPALLVARRLVDRAASGSFRNLSKIDYTVEEFQRIEETVAFLTNFQEGHSEQTIIRTSNECSKL